MSLLSRSLRRSVLCLLCLVPGVCAAQQSQQFVSVPQVEATGGRVTSFAAGTFQSPPSIGTDILYINAPVVTQTGLGAKSTVTVGQLLYRQGFNDFGQNQIKFQDVTNVVAALGDFNNDGLKDFAFALSPSAAGSSQICVYYGTGADVASAIQGNSSYNGGSAFPPVGKSGCLAITIPGNPPNLAYLAAVPGKAGFPPELVMEDSANNLLFIYTNTGASGTGGVLTGFTLLPTIAIPAADGAGPIYVGDFNSDGINDFIINGQTGHSASVYLGNANGTFQFSHRYVFDNNVHSMLLQDMDFDGHLDIVVEGDSGILEIFKGNANGTFAASSMGGTPAGVDGYSGNGGHLVTINPSTLDILTATPIGLGLLSNQGGLTYALKSIYNFGPGRTSFALADFFGTHNRDLAVDSPEGVAIIPGNPDGTFQTSSAFPSLSPALGATVGKFRNATNNPRGNVDVVVGTGAIQAQLLTGNGDGTFNTYPGVLVTSPPNIQPLSPPPPGVWSNILSGDFDGDGNLDVLYSLTGLPQPPPSGISALTSYIQYGNGDGTFSQSGNTMQVGVVSSNPNGLYPETATGDFNGDLTTDFAFSDAYSDTVWLGIKSNRSTLTPGPSNADSSNTDFSQVASGFFKVNRTSQQDVVFQQGAAFIPYVNKQDGTGKNFTAMTSLTGAAPPLYPATVLLTDVDGDGNGDLVVVYYNTTPNLVGAGPVAPYQVYIWWGNGDGTFTSSPLVLNLSRNYYLGAVADLNGDGRPDLVLSDGSLLSILFNQGNRSFGTPQGNGLLSSEAHYLAGQGINSISIADVNGDGEPDLILGNGGVTISNPIALGGPTATSLTLTPNPDVNTGGITVLLNSVITKPVIGTLVATPEPSNFGAAFTLTATLTPTPGVALPTGTVQFSIDGNIVGNPVAVVPGTTTSTATYVVPAGNTYVGGVHPLTATYSGDALNSALSLSGTPGTHLVQGGTTSVALNLCVGPSAACPSNGFINPPYVSTLPMLYGQTYNGTATVTANDGGPLPGSTQIFDAYNGAAPLLLCSLVTAAGGTCPPSVGIGAKVGAHVFTAVYAPGPNDTHTNSTSPSVTILVTQDTTTATLTGTPNPSPANQPVTFTATLTGSAAPPTGTVVFSYGATVLGSVALVPSSTSFSSIATLTTSALPVGTDTITVNYATTVNFASASATTTETITPSLAGTFTLTVTPTPISVAVGYAALLKVTVTPQNGFAQAVNLACSKLPTEVTCIFDSPQIAAGGGFTQAIIFTTAPHTCGTTQPYFYGSSGSGPGIAPFTLPTLAGLAALFLPGKRRWLRALIALVVVTVATQITGCGTCTDLGTRPATYTFRITGTAATTTTEVESQPVTMTVTL